MYNAIEILIAITIGFAFGYFLHGLMHFIAGGKE